ncbi:MAG TPA: BON domain-containing protein [Polyangiaceae bacterium]|nr:BON domain-containing protein [Polyangiaceae bacterium]
MKKLRRMKKVLLVALAALALGACKQKGDVDTTQTTGATVTAVDQKNDQPDIDLTASIRKSLVADRDLSLNAKNVKIISRDGNVTLRGVVETDAEKARVEDEAVRIAGVLNVTNELDVRK